MDPGCVNTSCGCHGAKARAAHCACGGACERCEVSGGLSGERSPTEADGGDRCGKGQRPDRLRSIPNIRPPPESGVGELLTLCGPVSMRDPDNYFFALTDTLRNAMRTGQTGRVLRSTSSTPTADILRVASAAEVCAPSMDQVRQLLLAGRGNQRPDRDRVPGLEGA